MSLFASRIRPGLFVVSSVASLLTARLCLAATHTLESSVLRLEMNTSPFTFKVIEKSSSQILVWQTNTTFAFGAGSYPASAAANVVITSTNLKSDLTLAGTSSVAQVTFTFTQPEVLAVLFSTTNSASRISQKFVDQGESYYGVWEYPQNGKLDLRGVDDPFLGITTRTNINYCSARAPFYMTSRKYGVYAETDAEGRFAFGISGTTSFQFNGPQLKFDVIYGPTFPEITVRYNSLAGGSYMPPAWAFSTIWWKDDDHKDFHTNATTLVTNAQSNVLDTGAKLQSCHIPASALWIDRPYGTGYRGWGNLDFDSSFPNPAQMIADLQSNGMNLMLWIANRCYSTNYLYTNGLALGYLFPGMNPPDGPAADLRITNAWTWFQSNLNTFVNMGIKGYKIDRGEEGELPDDVQNRNITLLQKLASEGISAACPNDNFIFSRNICDTGRKYSAVWNGDTTSTFTGLQYSVMSGLRSGLINFPMWGSDTGGYYNGPPTEELFARWFQFSAYSPMMEVLVGGGRTPWYDYSTNLINIARNQASAHHDLLPYTRSFLYKATQTGLPVMRALFYSYPDDTNAAGLWDEYLFGDKLLVAPVTTAGITSRVVYLPAGTWLDYNTKHGTFTGRTNITTAAPVDLIPLFAGAGAIMVRGDILKANNNWTPGWSPKLRIEVFHSDDAGSSFDYYTGSSVRTITCTNRNGALTVQFGDLGIPGDLEVYARNPGAVLRNGNPLSRGSDYSYDPTQRVLRIPFSGTTTLVVSNATSLFAPIEIWRTQTFGAGGDPSVSDDAADPDSDGLSNYSEYAFGSNPLNASSGKLPAGTILNLSGTNYLALSFQRATNAQDCTFTVFTSGDLLQWFMGSSYSGLISVPATAYTTEVSRSATNGIEYIKVRDNTPAPEAPRRFLSLKVTSP